jgi:N6-adenosine-specific RNA methylase IME4
LNKKYNVIYADPPWHYGSKSAVNNPSGSEIKPLKDQYPTMRLDELKSMEVKKLAEDDCACFMWVTDSHLDEALELMRSWGFTYKTVVFNWIKLTSKGNYCKNVAPWTMKSSEICLLGTKGAMTKYKKKNNVESLIIAERTKHSKKPDEARRRIEELFGDVPRLELFCRYPSEGWDSWGNEIESDIVLESK